MIDPTRVMDDVESNFSAAQNQMPQSQLTQNQLQMFNGVTQLVPGMQNNRISSTEDDSGSQKSNL